jgi:hypothetical protein
VVQRPSLLPVKKTRLLLYRRMGGLKGRFQISGIRKYPFSIDIQILACPDSSVGPMLTVLAQRVRIKITYNLFKERFLLKKKR